MHEKFTDITILMTCIIERNNRSIIKRQYKTMLVLRAWTDHRQNTTLLRVIEYKVPSLLEKIVEIHPRT